MEGEYDVLYIDPPWNYSNWDSKDNGAASSHYPCMTDQDVVDLPLHRLAKKDALVFAWLTGPKMAEIGVPRLFAGWGFAPVTTVFTWVKCAKGHRAPLTGLGFWSRSSTEFVALGRRGKGVPRQKDATNVHQLIEEEVLYDERMLPHSTKPLCVYDRIEQLVGPTARKLEVFARAPREGWDQTGLDFDGKDIRDVLAARGGAENP